MSEYPRIRPGMSLAERKAARSRILAEYLARAERDAAIAHRSMACGLYSRHETCVGERDGSGGCLCGCHDVEES